jgi:hypothetical protein
LRRLPLWRRRFPEKVTAASSDLLFFELELNRLDDELAAKVAARPLKHYRPWLEDIRKGTWAAIPLDQPIPMIASGVVGIIIIGILIWITLKGWLPYLWREWITSVDHKRIGIMYTLLAMVMLLRGFSDAIMMRSQQALAFQSPGYLPPEHYDQIFSAHGTLMIFFVAMPFVIGLMNFVVPLQLGVRDVAFPTLNSVGFWLTATGALLVNISLVVGELARIMRDLAVETSCRHLPSGTSRPIATGSRAPLASTGISPARKPRLRPTGGGEACEDPRSRGIGGRSGTNVISQA